MAANDRWDEQVQSLGAFIHHQRKLAQLSLRELAEKTNVSNPYLSQIERGLHEPSVRVLTAIARALNLSAETLLTQAGLAPSKQERGTTTGAKSTEAAIRADPLLDDEQKEALLAVYRSYVASRS